MAAQISPTMSQEIPTSPVVTKKLADNGDLHANWYTFKPANDNGPSVIGLNDWLEKPAGRRGGVRMVNNRFQI
jgi:hypothetical protein